MTARGGRAEHEGLELANMTGFQRGTLWHALTQATDEALRRGALQPIATECQPVADAGVTFLLRIVSSLARKEQARLGPRASAEPANPFLPYDPALFVADVSDRHVGLLNRFNVVPHHLLIVTRRFERQEAPLNLDDFQALCTCMAEYPSLGFYNAGAMAGASQPHKHLQLVPLPLAPGGPSIPLEPLIESARLQGAVGQSDRLPFPHAVAQVDPGEFSWPAQAARTMLGLYHQLMRVVFEDLELSGDELRWPPYNLLVTRTWMLLVPRCRESFESISLNALAFAGTLLVRDEQQLNALKRCGPMRAIRHVAGIVGP